MGTTNYLSAGFGTLQYENKRPVQPYSLKGLPEVFRNKYVSMDSEYEQLSRSKGQVISITNSTLPIEVPALTMELLELILGNTPQTTPEWNSSLHEIVNYSGDILSLSIKYSKTRVFSGMAGMVVLAPTETEISDVIYEFKGCDVLVIIRKEAGGFQLVGGAASFHSPTSSWTHARGDVHQNNEGVPEEFTLMVHMYLNIATLQALTCF